MASRYATDADHERFPPGTVYLERIERDGLVGDDIVLQPQPSDDPNDPLNWPKWRKYWNYGLVCLYVLMIAELIDAATPTWGPMNTELGFSYEVLNDSYAIGSGTLGLGGLLLLPFALKFGRRPIYIISTIAQFGFSIWSAKLQTVPDLLLINFFTCLFGGLSEVIVQMTIADVFFIHERGTMNSIYIWTFQIGASMGALVAGYITVAQGWRWLWWWNVIIFGACIFLFGFGYEETKYIADPAASPGRPQSTGTPAGSPRVPAELAPNESDQVEGKGKASLTDSQVKADDAYPATSATDAASIEQGLLCDDVYTVKNPRPLSPNIPRKTYLQKLGILTTSPKTMRSFLHNIWQPLVILVTIPAAGYMAVVIGVTSALSIMMTTCMSSTMPVEPYNFTSDQIGLMSLAPFIGITLGSMVIGTVGDRSTLWLAKRNNGIYEPEFRLYCMTPFIPFIAGGALMFGIALNRGYSWVLVAVGHGIASFGVAPINSMALTYITDAYTNVSCKSIDYPWFFH